ncbi:hypothetical protein MKK75_03380 [Methylobacterium sp. J-030]|uniref:MarR family winged helix-turn-helix transcriptional regulator n=1 Tax=Methylobacterium sp. J-030 TaxID=2836627 RepID=UPI001FB87548|nr:MarR family winged helix-turn-helix transcriptional regulator [Methylobacterium sp. J-030]MCJ2067859.1 hypothetical protein [Methylobacterium sp. J-030]
MGGEIIGNHGLPLKSLRRIKDVIGAFRSLEPNLPASYIDAFLAVALRPGLGPTDYASILGTIQPVASRTLMEIGKSARIRATSLHLVESRPHPENRRQIMYHLTPKGYALAYRVGMMLQGRQTPWEKQGTE